MNERRATGNRVVDTEEFGDYASPRDLFAAVLRSVSTDDFRAMTRTRISLDPRLDDDMDYMEQHGLT